MKAFKSPEKLQENYKNAVVVIGNFDGVHMGHQHIFKIARQKADELGCALGVLTFSPHPRAFFQQDSSSFYLMSEEQKREALARCGVDFVYTQTFDTEFSRLSAKCFVDQILSDTLSAQLCGVGFNFHFGHKREGDVNTLQALCRERGIQTLIMDEVQCSADERYSSSRARTYIIDADFKAAEGVLGHPWIFEGTVVKGDQRGRELGYPTANQSTGGYIRPPYGVYAVLARLKGQNLCLPAVANFGVRPMFRLDEPLLETHIFDFDDEIYGKILQIKFVERIRDEMKFDSLDDLVEQMDRDSQRAKNILSSEIDSDKHQESRYGS